MRWAVVEVMGHRRYVGQVEEVTVAGVPMLRVHVPGYVSRSRSTEWRTPAGEPVASWDEDGVEGEATITLEYQPYVVDLGGSALFAVTTCSEERARAGVEHGHDGPESPVRTVGEWVPRSRGALTGPVEDAEVVERVFFCSCGVRTETQDGECGTEGCEGWPF